MKSKNSTNCVEGDYTKLPLIAQRALDKFWFASDDIAEQTSTELEAYFLEAYENVQKVFLDLNLNIKAFV